MNSKSFVKTNSLKFLSCSKDHIKRYGNKKVFNEHPVDKFGPLVPAETLAVPSNNDHRRYWSSLYRVDKTKRPIYTEDTKEISDIGKI